MHGLHAPQIPQQLHDSAQADMLPALLQVCSSCSLRCNQEGVPVEAFLKEHLQHPQLVRLLDSATAQRGSRLGRADSSSWQSGGTSSRTSLTAFGESGDGYAERSSQLEMETWLLLEYCDMGTLMVRHRHQCSERVLSAHGFSPVSIFG